MTTAPASPDVTLSLEQKEARIEAFKEAVTTVQRVGCGFPLTQRGWFEFDTAVKALEKLIAKEERKHSIMHEGRVSAFREAAEYFDKYADTFPLNSEQRPAFRYAGVKMFALMEQEIAR